MSQTILPEKRLSDPLVDRRARTVRIAAGTGWDEIDAVTGPLGLATPGDPGHLTRRFGLAGDNLLEADVRFAGGRVLRAAPDQHPGLYWALRGGARLGHVTSALYRAHELGPVVGGPTYWAIEHAGAVLRAYREFLASAPRTLTGAFTLRHVPFPDERRVCGVLWSADSAEAIEPFLDALPEPLLHGVQPLPHAVLRRAFAVTGERSYLDDVPAELPDTLTLFPLDGAVRDHACGDTAWPHRGARFCAVAPVRLGTPRPCPQGGWECRRELAERLAVMRATYLGGDMRRRSG
jgi:hypothetical protein